ncbi:F0F1 ATP synthase subunit gamma [Prosthecobacter sp.]|uniref:F0F1 ATP synthase subunit gamma n=1 Tax=Prosthecobacter sp. TaxID=1965333 RepID=UPI0037837C0F
MSDTISSLQRQIRSAGDLQSVVRTMKALAASSIGQYEHSVHALADYWRTVELGLSVCLRQGGRSAESRRPPNSKCSGVTGAIVFGSDQGLVGQFNDIIADYAIKTLAALPGRPQVWAVGERVHARLADAGLTMAGCFSVPSSVKAITPLIAQIQIQSEAQLARLGCEEAFLFHNRPQAGSLYEPVSQRLLPLDEIWQKELTQVPWPTKILPEVLHDLPATLSSLIREYLFISLFRACAESLASENASRLAAMQRAEKNIDDLLERLHGSYHRLRQSSIDEELFDVVSGYEALEKDGKNGHAAAMF